MAIGVPAPTVTGHVAEDQGLGFSVFREGAPEQPQIAGPSSRQEGEPQGSVLKSCYKDALVSILRI